MAPLYSRVALDYLELILPILLLGAILTSVFKGCTGLSRVDITDIAAWCNIDFGDDYANPLSYAHNLYLNGNKVTDLVIPNSVTSINSSAFYKCTGLTSVTIPNSVTWINSYAFEGCTGLTSVTIPNSVTSIGSSAFRGCTGLTSVTIPNSVTSIGTSAFTSCDNLEEVTINSNAILSKGYSSSNNIKNIFGTQVKQYLIGNTVTSIGNYAFSGCIGLTSVTIGNSVTSIGENAFAGCSGLSKVHSLNTTPPVITESTFDEETEQNASLLVPTGCHTIYWLHPYWENFITIEEEECYVTGDTNQDGFVTSADVTAIYDILLGVNNTYVDACDVNGDGYITSADVTAIYDILLGNQ